MHRSVLMVNSSFRFLLVFASARTAVAIIIFVRFCNRRKTATIGILSSVMVSLTNCAVQTWAIYSTPRRIRALHSWRMLVLKPVCITTYIWLRLGSGAFIITPSISRQNLQKTRSNSSGAFPFLPLVAWWTCCMTALVSKQTNGLFSSFVIGAHLTYQSASIVLKSLVIRQRLMFLVTALDIAVGLLPPLHQQRSPYKHTLVRSRWPGCRSRWYCLQTGPCAIHTFLLAYVICDQNYHHSPHGSPDAPCFPLLTTITRWLSSRCFLIMASACLNYSLWYMDGKSFSIHCGYDWPFWWRCYFLTFEF